MGNGIFRGAVAAGGPNPVAARAPIGARVELSVECYAGHRGEETPRRIDLGGRRVEVVEVIDRWYGPDHRYFKLRGDDGAIYLLRHDEPADRWELTLFERGRV